MFATSNCSRIVILHDPRAELVPNHSKPSDVAISICNAWFQNSHGTFCRRDTCIVLRTNSTVLCSNRSTFPPRIHACAWTPMRVEYFSGLRRLPFSGRQTAHLLPRLNALSASCICRPSRFMIVPLLHTCMYDLSRQSRADLTS